MGCMTVGRTVYRRYTDVIDFNISKIFLSNDKLLMKTIFSNPMCISLHSTLFYCASKRKAASLSLTDLLVLVISRCCFDFKVDWWGLDHHYNVELRCSWSDVKCLVSAQCFWWEGALGWQIFEDCNLCILFWNLIVIVNYYELLILARTKEIFNLL